MDDWQWILALVGGVALGAFIAYFFAVPKPTGYSLAPKPVATYSNLEEWELQRDETGRLQGVKVHRDAKQT